MQELWQPIEGSDGYEVSNLGRVRVIRYLKTDRGGNSGGYRTVTLPGKKQRYVHRLVAQAFIPNPDQLPEVNHIDNDPRNAVAENLEWCNSKQNKMHAIKHGNRNRKLSPAQVLEIRKRLSEGGSLTSIANDYGCHLSTISRIGRREIYDWVA